jgi:predicted TIM-barrel fold metal-dependent hydrolase
MFKTSDGEEIFVIDAHIHLWDARPENQRNVHGAQFINCFHNYQKD